MRFTAVSALTNKSEIYITNFHQEAQVAQSDAIEHVLVTLLFSNYTPREFILTFLHQVVSKCGRHVLSLGACQPLRHHCHGECCDISLN